MLLHFQLNLAPFQNKNHLPMGIKTILEVGPALVEGESVFLFMMLACEVVQFGAQSADDHLWCGVVVFSGLRHVLSTGFSLNSASLF